MLNKIQNPKANYIYRLAVLPLIAITVLAFTIRTKTYTSTEPLQKKLTVVIDAGHGKKDGKFTGAQVQDQYEDAIVLAIATKIKEFNNDPNLEIVLTRPSEDIVSLERRVALAKATGADLFLSLHIGANPHNAEKSGIDVLISGKNKTFDSGNEIIASLLTQELKAVYNTKNFIRQTTGVYVLDKTPCPSVLLEVGYLTNSGDFNFIQQPGNQEQIAKRILAAIEKYSAATSESIRVIPATEERPLNKTKSDATPNAARNNKETKLTITSREVIQLQTTAPDLEKTETKNVLDGPVFTAVEIEAYIDKQVWRDFLSSNLGTVLENLVQNAPPGSYAALVRFIVHRDGHLSDFTITKDPGYDIGQAILKIMPNSPKWNPAIQNGKAVNAYQTQPITLVIAEEPATENQLSIEDLKSMNLHQLLKLDKDVEVLSCSFITGLPNGDLLEVKHTGNILTEADRKFFDHLTKGEMMTIENIMVLVNGKTQKLPSILYKL